MVKEFIISRPMLSVYSFRCAETQPEVQHVPFVARVGFRCCFSGGFKPPKNAQQQFLFMRGFFRHRRLVLI